MSRSKAFFFMKIEQIIYDTTREVFNLEDKLSIATIFLFCDKLGRERLADLLYCENKEKLIEDLQNEFKDYDVDFSIRFSNPNVLNAFNKTIEKYKEKNDADGFLKAVYEKDEFAMVICEIVNYRFDKVEFKNFIGQLSLF